MGGSVNVRHGRPYGQCDYCGRWVRLSGLFAGIHVCISDEERAMVDHLRAQGRYAQEAQMRAKPIREFPTSATKSVRIER